MVGRNDKDNYDDHLIITILAMMIMMWPSCVRAEAWDGHGIHTGAALKRSPTVFWYCDDDIIKRIGEKILSNKLVKWYYRISENILR